MTEKENDDQYVIGEHHLEGLLKNLKQGGIRLSSLDWYRLGQELKIDQDILNDAKTYFDILRDLMIILTGSEDIKVTGIGLCLTIWCRSTHIRPTLQSLTDALVSIGEGPTVNKINGTYYIKKALKNRQTIKLKWTTLSISGPQGTGKSCFLRLLHNIPFTSLSPEVTLKLSSNTDAILETSDLMVSKDSTSDPWEAIDTTVLKRMILSEVTSDAVCGQSVRPPTEAYIDVDVSLASSNKTLKTLDDRVRQLLEERVQAVLHQLPSRTLTIIRLKVTPMRLTECLDRLNALRSKSDDMLKLSNKLPIYLGIKASLSKLIALEENLHLLGSVLPSLPPPPSLPTATVTPVIITSIAEEEREGEREGEEGEGEGGGGGEGGEGEGEGGGEGGGDDVTLDATPPPIPPRPSRPSSSLQVSSHPTSFDSIESPLTLTIPPPRPPRMTSSVSMDTLSSLPITLGRVRNRSFDVTKDLVDVLSDLTSLPRSLSKTHFVHVITTRGNPSFRDLIPALFRYNTANVITHPLNEELDTYTGQELTHQEILESSIHSLTYLRPPSRRGTMSLQRPNFIVLGTYYDMLNYLEDTAEIKEYIAVRNHQIKSKLTSFSEYILRYGSSLVFPVNTTSPDNDHTLQVTEAIRRKLSKCYIETEVPLVWFLFQLALVPLRRLKTIVEKSELIKLGRNFKMSSEDVEHALLHFHDLSVVFYFPRFLEEIVFLNPQHFLDRLSRLCQLEKFNRQILINLMENSIFVADSFLKLLKSLYLVTPTGPNEVEYFFPSVLNRAPNTYLETMDENRGLDPLVLKWDTGPVPQGLFPALVVALVRDHEFELTQGRAEPKCRNAVRLTESSEDVTLLDYFYWIEIHFDDSLRCHSIKSKIYSAIKEVLGVFKYDPVLSSPKEHFLCLKEHGENTKEHSVERHLCKINESKEMVTCSLDGTSSLINFTRQLPWLRVTISHKNKYIEDVGTVLTILKEGSFRFRKWVKLGLSLNLDRTTLNGIKHDSTSKCLEECLTIWKSRNRVSKWIDLVNALVEIDETTAADYIRNQL